MELVERQHGGELPHRIALTSLEQDKPRDDSKKGTGL